MTITAAKPKTKCCLNPSARPIHNISCNTTSDLQRLPTGVILTVVNRKLVANNWGVHRGVNWAQALRGVVVPVQSQVGGVESCPLSRAHVYLQGDHSSATVNCQVWIVYERDKARMVRIYAVTIWDFEEKSIRTFNSAAKTGIRLCPQNGL